MSTYAAVYAGAAVFAVLSVGLWMWFSVRKTKQIESPSRARKGLLVADDSKDLSVNNSKSYGVPIVDVQRSRDVKIKGSETLFSNRNMSNAVQEAIDKHNRNDRVLDAIDAWHESGSEETRPLHEYLGWTWEEYKHHVEDPDYLPPEREGAV